MSFVNYVLSWKHCDCQYGDLARDMENDPNIRKRWGATKLKKYIESQNGSCGHLVDELVVNFKIMPPPDCFLPVEGIHLHFPSPLL